MNQSIYTLLILLLIGCQNSPTSEKNEEKISIPKTEEPSPSEETASLYPWVDKLNVRDQPNLKGKTITSVNTGEAMESMGVKSDNAETIVLRGIAYHDRWYKIRTSSGIEGWVYGGAVKRKGEQKGNAPITEMKFDYPKFGKYDLSNWEYIGSEGMGEEVDGEKRAYKSGDYYFHISNPSIGEFGYSFTQDLLNGTWEAIKHREFSFQPSGTPDMPHKLVETIEDYEQNPAKKYTRTQEIDKHYYHLNAKPMMVAGEWKEEVLSATDGQ